MCIGDFKPKKKKKKSYLGARYPNVPAIVVAINLSPSCASSTKPKSETFARKSSHKSSRDSRFSNGKVVCLEDQETCTHKPKASHFLQWSSLIGIPNVGVEP